MPVVKETCARVHTHTHTHTQKETYIHTHRDTPSSWEPSCHCLPGPWPVERESYLSFCSARGSHLNTASVVSFSQHDDGERVREGVREKRGGERETEEDYKRGFN